MDNNQNLDNIIDDQSSSNEAISNEENINEEADTEEIVDEESVNEESVNEGITESQTEAVISGDPEATDEKPRLPRGFSLAASLYDYVEIFAIAVVAVLFIFTFCIRLCRVDGDSMNKTLNHNETIISSNFFYKPKQGDIIVFHLSNDHYSEPLVKRVIATEGQRVEINLSNGVVKVDGRKIDDRHAYLSNDEYVQRGDLNKNFVFREGTTMYFRATVPEGHVFVLGDNRNGSSDSRTDRVGFVDVDCILGKAVLRISPFTFLDQYE